MNSLLKAIQEELNITFTENGDIAYKSTLNKNLDFFSGISQFYHGRGSDRLIYMFLEAFGEDKVTALKNLFYLRDIRKGAGERSATRSVLVYLANNNPEVFKFIVPIIPELGRWDDLTKILPEIFNVDSVNYLVGFIQNQLSEDIKNYKEGKSISLLAKWMPSLNNKKQRSLAISWKNLIFGKQAPYKDYQHILVLLRQRLDLVETYLTNSDYTFDYNKLPAKASLRYRSAFDKNDKDRYEKFINNLSKDYSDKVNKLQPQEILRLIGKNGYLLRYNTVSKEKIKLANAYWEAFPRQEYKSDKNMIVVRDGSGSMVGEPLEVATAMAIFASEQLSGDFKDKFITFSRNPQLVDLGNCDTFYEKLLKISKYDDISNTDFDKTFKLLYNANIKAKEEDRIDEILVISDMQFDKHSFNANNSTFDKWKVKFLNAGMKMPKVIFWNVRLNEVVYPTIDLDNVYLVSGYSKAILEDAMRGIEPDALKHMKSVLSKYDNYFKNTIEIKSEPFVYKPQFFKEEAQQLQKFYLDKRTKDLIKSLDESNERMNKTIENLQNSLSELQD